MKRFLGLGGLLTACSCPAQRVIYARPLIQQPYSGPAIRAIHPHRMMGATITVRYADGHQQAIPKDSIWGYEDGRGRLYRYYKREFYRVMGVGELISYLLTRPNGRGVVNTRYFSRDFDSAIHWSRTSARLDSSRARQ